MAWLAEYLKMGKGDLVACRGGVLAISLFKREIGWARIDPGGRLSWGRHKLAHYRSEKKRTESGSRYLAHVLKFERPYHVILEKPPNRRRKIQTIKEITKTAERLASTLDMATSQVPLQSLKGGKGTKIVDLAPWLFKLHPELAKALELDRESPAFAFNAKYWRSVFIALAIIHQNQS